MTTDEKFMHRCLQLARKGEGYARPNPLVGAVIVHKGVIIGEGYHRCYGGHHAEVNAVNSVKKPELLSSSTMYVSLEPCAHYGKTPPCAELIVACRIPEVVVAVPDPNPKVSGKGIDILREAGVKVTVGVLEKEASALNRPFFVNQIYKRPYIILKWAQSADGFIDHERKTIDEKLPARLSNDLTSIIVHKFRTRIQGIMVGTRTAMLDNPKLTSRKWFGNNPVRIVIDREAKLPVDSAIFDDEADVIVFCQTDYPLKKKNLISVVIDFEKDTNIQILQSLFELKIYSIMIEGGSQLLSTFIDKNLWDEAFVEVSSKMLLNGVKAPTISLGKGNVKKLTDSCQHHLKNEISQKFI